MQSVAIHQAKSQLAALVHAVEQGEGAVLTRHGKRVARIVAEPAAGTAGHGGTEDAQAVRREALDKLEEFRSMVRPGKPLDWKELRDAGRKY